jgi:hypothetical protein
VDLLGRVREDFGIPLIGVRPTGLGADARAVLFRGETADGTAYAVKTSTAPQPGLAVADFLDFADAVFADDARDLAHDLAHDLARDPADRAAALRIAAGALSPGGLVSITLSKAGAGH